MVAGELEGAPSLAERLSALAQAMQAARSVQDTLEAIVEAAVATVPGARYASLSAVRGRREVVTVASTGELARAVDQAQYDSGEGPCLDALYHRASVLMPDLGVESRWPDFVTRARQLAVGSLLAVQLFVEGDDLAALNMQSPHPHAFTDESEHIARLFAAHAAVALAGAEQRAHLTVALDSRDAIGQAKGILMERHKVTAAQAFDLLVRASSLTNRRLVAVADQLITTGVLPEA